MTDQRKQIDPEVDKLLREAARNVPELPDGLMRRIIGDAEALLPESRNSRPRGRRGRLGKLWAGFGGWPALAGLAAVTLVGIWLGYSPPGFIEGIAGAAFADGAIFEPLDYMISFDNVLGEG